jgi:hypothetical protein
MKTKIFLLTLLLSTLFFSCKKIEQPFTSADPSAGTQAQSFLKTLQATATATVAKKIEQLAKNLGTENPIRITNNGAYNTVYYPLKDYTIKNTNGYAHIFYKIAFRAKGNEIKHAVIYTIRTNLSEEDVNRDLENILSLRNTNFTGEIITNKVTDEFLEMKLAKNGRLSAVKTTRKKTADAASKENNTNSATGENCYAVYLVTTFYFSDGTIYEMEQYLYTNCLETTIEDPCISIGEPATGLHPECNTGGGTGGGEPTPLTECEEIQNAMGSMTLTTINTRGSVTGPSITDPTTDEIIAPKTCQGTTFKYNFLWYDPEFTPFYTGTVYKTSATDPLWKWKTFAFNSFDRSGGTMPPFMSATTTAAVSTAIVSERRANVSGTGHINFVVSCGLGTYSDFTKEPNLSDYFFSDQN